MTERTLEKIEDILIWTLISIFFFLIAFAAAYLIKVAFFASEEKIHTETMYVEDHKYIIFYDADNEIQHIEHSPECDCFTVEYD